MGIAPLHTVRSSSGTHVIVAAICSWPAIRVMAACSAWFSRLIDPTLYVNQTMSARVTAIKSTALPWNSKWSVLGSFLKMVPDRHGISFPADVQRTISRPSGRRHRTSGSMRPLSGSSHRAIPSQARPGNTTVVASSRRHQPLTLDVRHRVRGSASAWHGASSGHQHARFFPRSCSRSRRAISRYFPAPWRCPRHADQAAQQHLEQIYAFGPGAVFSDNERVTHFVVRSTLTVLAGIIQPFRRLSCIASLGGHDVEPSVPEGRFACDAGSRP